MACKVTQGIENSCEDVLLVGGVDKTFWVGYLSDLDTQILLDQAAPIRTLDFGSYGGLYRFDGRKYAHNFTQSLQVSAGGNKSYAQTFVAKLLSKTTENDLTLQQLALGEDIFIVYQDNNRNFKIAGAGNGLSATADENTTGQEAGADITNTITLTGAEKTKALYFSLLAGYQATLDYIESREI
jgi:hypothetical protein